MVNGPPTWTVVLLVVEVVLMVWFALTRAVALTIAVSKKARAELLPMSVAAATDVVSIAALIKRDRVVIQSDGKADKIVETNVLPALCAARPSDPAKSKRMDDEHTCRHFQSSCELFWTVF